MFISDIIRNRNHSIPNTPKNSESNIHNKNQVPKKSDSKLSVLYNPSKLNFISSFLKINKKTFLLVKYVL